jgi:Na+/H+ antiporter NhaA
MYFNIIPIMLGIIILIVEFSINHWVTSKRKSPAPADQIKALLKMAVYYLIMGLLLIYNGILLLNNFRVTPTTSFFSTGYFLGGFYSLLMGAINFVFLIINIIVAYLMEKKLKQTPMNSNPAK